MEMTHLISKGRKRKEERWGGGVQRRMVISRRERENESN